MVTSLPRRKARAKDTQHHKIWGAEQKQKNPEKKKSESEGEKELSSIFINNKYLISRVERKRCSWILLASLVHLRFSFFLFFFARPRVRARFKRNKPQIARSAPSSGVTQVFSVIYMYASLPPCNVT
jgi:hypothetical protein